MASPTSKQVLIIPYPAYGHIIPMLELARKLSANHAVTFAVSSSCIENMSQRELQSTADHIQLLPIEDGFSDTAFPNLHDESVFVASIRCILPPVQQLIMARAESTDIVIVDSFIAKGVHEACVENNIPFYHFCTGRASSTLDYFKDVVDLGMFPYSWNQLAQQVQGTFKDCAGVIVNSVRELEEQQVEELKFHAVTGKLPIYFVGPLFPVDKPNPGEWQQQQQIIEWLDSKNPSSVVYVSHGSVVVPSAPQIQQLAQAFLLMDQPIIWSLPKSHHQYLPEGLNSEQFKERLLIVTWAPQKPILSHASTAVFLTHCGWNSTLEGISTGVPMVAWPMFADQYENADLVVERGLGVKVEGTGTEAKRVVPAAEIVAVLEKVAGWAEMAGDVDFAENARKLAEVGSRCMVAPNGSSYVDTTALLQFCSV